MIECRRGHPQALYGRQRGGTGPRSGEVICTACKALTTRLLRARRSAGLPNMRDWSQPLPDPVRVWRWALFCAALPSRIRTIRREEGIDSRKGDRYESFGRPLPAVTPVQPWAPIRTAPIPTTPRGEHGRWLARRAS